MTLMVTVLPEPVKRSVHLSTASRSFCIGFVGYSIGRGVPPGPLQLRIYSLIFLKFG